MQLEIYNKDLFVTHFLQPISRFTDNCIIKNKNGLLSCFATSNDNTIVLYTEYKNSTQEDYTLNLPDIKKFAKILLCVEEPDLKLNIDNNSINYKSLNSRFKYHLFEDNVIKQPPFNLEKFKQIPYDCFFTITRDKLVQAIKMSSLSDDNERFYFSFLNSSVDIEITNKTKQNSNNFSFTASTDLTGNATLSSSFSFKFDILQSLSQYKVDKFSFKFASQLGVLLIELDSENSHTKFLITAIEE